MPYNHLYHLLLVLAFGPDVQALASADFHTREAAEASLTRWVDFCWPLLQSQTYSPDLEVRRRSRRILASGIPANPPPIGLLVSRPYMEWTRYTDGGEFASWGERPGDDWHLTWIRLPPKSSVSLIVRHYGERARTQTIWMDWQSDNDGRSATVLLCRDLQALGVPRPAIRYLVDYLNGREKEVSYPPEKYRMEKVTKGPVSKQ